MRKLKLIKIILMIVGLSYMISCSSGRGSDEKTSTPKRITHSKDARLSIKDLGDSLLLEVRSKRADMVHSLFFIDFDYDSTTGIQRSINTNWHDQSAQKKGQVGADLLVSDGTLYYYNNYERRWREWYHSWQRLGRLKYAHDKDRHIFRVWLPKNLYKRYHAHAIREDYHPEGMVIQYSGDMDFRDLARQFNGKIRVEVELANRDWNRKIVSNIKSADMD